MRQLKRMSLWAAATAILAEAGMKNILLSALVTVGTPATATGFVYEVMHLRKARLDHEAHDRAVLAAKKAAPPPDDMPPEDTEGRVGQARAAEDEGAPVFDLSHRLSAMLAARTQFVDLYGETPEAVTPAYRKIAQDMLALDDRMTARLTAEQRKDPDRYATEFAAKAAELKTLHEKLAPLAPARVATSEAADGPRPRGAASGTP